MMNFTGKRYKDFNSFIKIKFGHRIQKISIDAGFTCPNRDGSLGYGGCTYCNNQSFSPNYKTTIKPISEQLIEGISFFNKKYPAQNYLAYFQSYTNTYADFNQLKKLYEEALRVKGVVGLVIGTRPDCISDELIDYLTYLSKDFFVVLELGIESTLNTTLKNINRCHTFEDTVKAFDKCKDKGFYLGGHLILGLPNESKETMLNHVEKINNLPILFLKIHHLQIIKNSVMAIQYKRNPDMFNLFTLEKYINFVTDFISNLRPDIVVERFISESPNDLLIAPKWGGFKNFEIIDKIDKKLVEKNTWQGKNYH